MKKIKRILTVVICVNIASQLYFNFLIQGFTIAFSVVVFSIFLYNYVELNPIKIAIITGITTSSYKFLWFYSSNSNFTKIFERVTPEVIFFAIYGIIFYFLYYRDRKRDLTKFTISIFFCDFVSNIIELCIRTKMVGIDGNMIRDLLIVACARASVTLIILIAMKYYRLFLIKEEHEERYRRLILVTSLFKSEIYFMNKNAAEIEDVMRKSFSVYEIVSKKHYPDELKNLTLDIAKDVHEIKKDYIRVMRGLEEISNDKIDVEQMKIKDMVNILELDTKDYIVTKNLNIELDFKYECDFYVSEHFYLMSIIRNLVFNSIEAIDSKKRGVVKLRIREIGTEYVFSVSDNGTGISKSNLDFIFNPGFSTKYDKETGSICRGIGLTLVKDLVQDIFKGSISVQSIENKNTVFTVKVPVDLFRG
ncbi:ATP-binding protein [Clostridiaceae bacterium UIB06]|uniref:ATP-binding protein n=1 Tax=Clostridium thailandense TaxID=2794346 RepID=A0A949TNC6_9CLOT|nr:ATP-binding protein [Clostridium thailandense]MBV7276039.1 ATP-binding protein [Clostridium thailandense]MCH5137002.1 ATP-binding protein [Clostridiaceae bacterium UIB06]